MNQNEYLGIDIGASGIKGAIINVKSGELLSERIRIPTPSPSTPKAVATAFAELVRQFGWKNKIIGVGFPSIIKKGVAHTAANIHQSWIGTNVETLFTEATKCHVVVKNDADVAGIAEMQFGKGKGRKGTVLIVTIGTGLGSALFFGGKLVPNTEFGHFYLKGHNKVVEQYTSDGVRKKKDLSWKIWALRFDKYLQLVNKLLSPDLIILGGGSSKRFEKYQRFISIKTPIQPADLLNNAGIIGAAVFASRAEIEKGGKAANKSSF